MIKQGYLIQDLFDELVDWCVSDFVRREHNHRRVVGRRKANAHKCWCAGVKRRRASTGRGRLARQPLSVSLSGLFAIRVDVDCGKSAASFVRATLETLASRKCREQLGKRVWSAIGRHANKRVDRRRDAREHRHSGVVWQPKQCSSVRVYVCMCVFAFDKNQLQLNVQN